MPVSPHPPTLSPPLPLSAYIFTLLHVGLGIGLDDRCLRFTNTLSVPLSSRGKGAREGQGSSWGEARGGSGDSGGGMDDGADGPSVMEVPLNWINGAVVTDAMSEERDSSTSGWVAAAVGSRGALPLMLLPAGVLVLAGLMVWWRQRQRRGTRPSSSARLPLGGSSDPAAQPLARPGGYAGEGEGGSRGVSDGAGGGSALPPGAPPKSRLSRTSGSTLARPPSSFTINVQDS